MARHLGIGSVETGVVAIGVGDGGLEIIADHKLRHAAQKPEQIGMHADPVGQALGTAAGASRCGGAARLPHINRNRVRPAGRLASATGAGNYAGVSGPLRGSGQVSLARRSAPQITEHHARY